jgi:subtilisin family serine protease
LFGFLLTTYIDEVTNLAKPVYSISVPGELSNNTEINSKSIQSILENSPEGSRIADEQPVSEFQITEPIEIIPNSFIVQLKTPEVGALEETVDTFMTDLTAAGGNISAVYDNLGMFNVKFEEPEGVAGAADVNLSSSAQQFLEELKANPAVEAVFNDALVSIDQQVLPKDQDRVDADLSSTKSGDGDGTVDADIAILDTGVQFDHPDLNVFQCVSFVNNPTANTPLNTCSDGNGHGTHVAGTAAALDNNIGIVGKAPGARIWALKVLGDNGKGSFSDILEGLNFVISHSNEIDVVNMSLGGQGTAPPVEKTITDLVNKNGVVVVVSAGNSNLDASGFTPARTPAAITVSAITDSDGKCGGNGSAISLKGVKTHQPATVSNPDDFIASYSNFGSVVDIAAPGTNVLSTLPLSISPTGLGIKSGTSMAAPNVAGAVALFKAQNPTATPAQVEAFLKSSGTKGPLSGNPLVPCDGNGKGYFNDKYPPALKVRTDPVKEPLLFMAQSSPTPPPNPPPSPPTPPTPPPSPVASCDPKSPTLRIGSTGDKVSELQSHLTQLGFGELLGAPGIDGKFGSLTQNAVKAFQRDNSLQIDGIVGPMTWGAICQAIASTSGQSLSAAPQQSEENAAPMQISPQPQLQPETALHSTAQQATENVTTEAPLVCNDGSSPDPTTGLCPDGLPPSSNVSSVASPPTENVTTEAPLVCNDGSSPDPTTGLCPDGLPPTISQ